MFSPKGGNEINYMFSGGCGNPNCRLANKSLLNNEYQTVIKLIEKGEYSDAAVVIAKLDRERRKDFRLVYGKMIVFYSSGEVASVYKLSYDADGNIHKKEYINSKGNTLLTTYYTYYYDRNGNIVNKEQTDSDGDMILTTKYIYTYDNIGNIIKEEYVDSDGDTLHTINYTYDSNCDLVKSKLVYSYGSMETTKYTYDNNDNIIIEEYVGSNGDVKGVSEFTYNNGFLVKAVHTNSEGEKEVSEYSDHKIIYSPQSSICKRSL